MTTSHVRLIEDLDRLDHYTLRACNYLASYFFPFP